MTDTPSEREEDRGWTRLHRRKVVQWGFAYTAGAWLLLQVFGFASDVLEWPAIAKPLARLGSVIGLPIALTLAWYHGALDAAVLGRGETCKDIQTPIPVKERA